MKAVKTAALSHEIDCPNCGGKGKVAVEVDYRTMELSVPPVMAVATTPKAAVDSTWRRLLFIFAVAFGVTVAPYIWVRWICLYNTKGPVGAMALWCSGALVSLILVGMRRPLSLRKRTLAVIYWQPALLGQALWVCGAFVLVMCKALYHSPTAIRWLGRAIMAIARAAWCWLLFGEPK
jgi:hypothetical protein